MHLNQHERLWMTKFVADDAHAASMSAADMNHVRDLLESAEAAMRDGVSASSEHRWGFLGRMRSSKR